VTRADRDLVSGAASAVRQAHGLFARWSPVKPVVVLAEADGLVWSSSAAAASTGHASLLQVDLEAVQGLHLLPAAESLHELGLTSYGGWLGLSWFFLNNAEVRVDGIVRQNGGAQGSFTSVTFLGQLHLSM
jgi:hypothetical protein